MGYSGSPVPHEVHVLLLLLLLIGDGLLRANYPQRSMGDVGWGVRGPPYIPFRSHFPGWLACGWVGSGIVPICSMCCALLCCVADLWLGWSCICSISFHVLYTDFGWVVVDQWVKC